MEVKMNKLDLNDKEQKVLDFIISQVKDTGYPPSVREICKAVGFKSTCSAHQYIQRLADKGYLEKSSLKMRALKVVEDEKEETVALPIVGKVAAGEPILATQNIEDYFSIGESFFSKDSLKNDNFVLRVQGESMINAGINNGDFIVVSKQETARNGEIVVAMIEGDATVKTYYKEKSYIRLQPENDTMDPIISDKVQIVGKVIGLFRKIN
jgi:repressor LexA